ncbi:uncharacterized protein LOC142567915 [Dermacentor variabilis]|uniref:uncharacterized protein LOC142567915 n=1 Tax=Dermacentor variabilis TaxID=34621 RepID=UPI003F5BF09C
MDIASRIAKCSACVAGQAGEQVHEQVLLTSFSCPCFSRSWQGRSLKPASSAEESSLVCSSWEAADRTNICDGSDTTATLGLCRIPVNEPWNVAYRLDSLLIQANLSLPLGRGTGTAMAAPLTRMLFFVQEARRLVSYLRKNRFADVARRGAATQ